MFSKKRFSPKNSIAMMANKKEAQWRFLKAPVALMPNKILCAVMQNEYVLFQIIVQRKIFLRLTTNSSLSYTVDRCIFKWPSNP